MFQVSHHSCLLVDIPPSPCTMRSMIPIVFLLVSLSSQAEEGVRYCDKVFDLVDRTDESWARCRWSDSLSPGSLTDCEGGLECEGECVPWSDWCPPQPGSTTVWRCGGLLSSPELCSNSATWSGRPCGATGSRCTGWWPGQCSQPGTTVTQKIF